MARTGDYFLITKMTIAKRTVLGILGILLIAACALGQDTQVTASVSSDTIGAQDQLQYTITVSGANSGDAEAPRQLRLQGFKVVSGPSVGTQFQWINGRTNNSKTFGYILIPDKEGQFTIDPVEVRVGGKTYKTQPVQVLVTSASRAPQPQRQRQNPFNPFDPFDPFEEDRTPRSQPAGDAVMVRAEVDRNSAYPGQQVTLTYKIYTQVDITGVNLRESPSLTGFWVEDLQVDKNPKPTRQIVNGKEYLVYTVKKAALFANKTGRLAIPPITLGISARTGSNLFGMFGRDETIYRKSQELSLDVKPLPEEGKPSNYSNAVGVFTLGADVDRKQVATGEGVALHIKLEGRGNLKMIPNIPLPSLPDFTIYSSKNADNIRSLEQDQIGGDKTWEYVVVPKNPGNQTIPPLSFSYFDAEKNRYETVSTPAIALAVTRGADSGTGVAVLPGSNKQDLKRRATDINFIKLASDSFKKKSEPFYRQLWMYLAVALPLLLNAGIFIYQRQKTRPADNSAFARSRKARRNALSRLKAAERESQTAPRRFYDLASAALTGYLSDKFNRTEIELTEDGLARTLLANSVPEETVEEIKSCLRDCDFGRFVSAAQSPEKMQILSARIRKAIDHLEIHETRKQ
jgi:hypothetical protein